MLNFLKQFLLGSVNLYHVIKRIFCFLNSFKLSSDYDLGGDRLSDLPLSIIHTILSSLPIKDAVRTSILSREWRYTWTGIPKLEFISNADGNQDEKTASEKRLKEFISYALSVHKGSLHTFKLRWLLEEPCPNLDEWLICLSTKDIKELRLTGEFPSFRSLHSISSVYSCNKLTHLHLFQCDVGPPPSTFNGFPFLRELTLCAVKISNATFESLVSNSPLLESLHRSQFAGDEKDSMIRVHAPNLKCLLLAGSWTELSVNAPLLSEIKIGLITAIELQRGSICNYTNLLGGCTNLEELVASDKFLQFMSIGMESWNPNPLVLHRLRTILLGKVEFRDVKQQRVLARLLVGAPNLHNLSISTKMSSETRDVHFSDFGFDPNFRLEKLRDVKIFWVRGLLPEIKFIEFLLERSPLLEIMRVGQMRGTIDISDKMLACTRASQNATLRHLMR